METIQYSKQQLEAIAQQTNSLSYLVNRYDKGIDEFGLFARAGCGKSFVAAQLIKEVRDRDPAALIACAAISHSAKNVLKSSFIKTLSLNDEDIEDYDDVEFYTVAKLLNLKRVIKSDGEISFEPKTTSFWNGKTLVKIKPPIFYASLVIIDECSQINESTRKMLNQEKGPQTRLVYLGDWHQTPPVEENSLTNKEVQEQKLVNKQVDNIDSSTFDLEAAYMSIPFRYEGDIERLAGAMADEIDKDVDKDGPYGIKFLNEFFVESKKKLEAGEECDFEFVKDKKEFFGRFMEDYRKSIHSDNPLKEVVLINYRKNTTKELSKLIRKAIFKKEGKEHMLGTIFTKDERIICKRGNPSIEGLTTHRQFIIKGVNPHYATVVFRHGELEDIFIKNHATMSEYDDYGVVFKQIPILKLTLQDEIKEWYHNIPVLMDEQNLDYITMKNFLFNRAVRCEDKDKKSENWVKYYKFIEFFNDFSYACASHTYVVQGETYNKVYVNLRDIMSVSPITMRSNLSAEQCDPETKNNNMELVKLTLQMTCGEGTINSVILSPSGTGEASGPKSSENIPVNLLYPGINFLQEAISLQSLWGSPQGRRLFWVDIYFWVVLAGECGREEAEGGVVTVEVECQLKRPWTVLTHLGVCHVAFVCDLLRARQRGRQVLF